MPANRLLEIAQALGKLYTDQAAASIRLSHLTDDLAARKIALMPFGGWEGKNAEQREAAALIAYASDTACQAMTAEISAVKDAAALLDAQVKALEVERKAREWTIRAHLVDALRGETSETPTGQVEENGFDTAQDDAVDDRIETNVVELADAAYYETVVVHEMEAARVAQEAAAGMYFEDMPF